MARRIVTCRVITCLALLTFVSFLVFFQQGSHMGLRNDNPFSKDINVEDTLNSAKQKPGKFTQDPSKVIVPQNKEQEPQAQDQQQPEGSKQGETAENPGKKANGEAPNPKTQPQQTFAVDDDLFFDPSGPKPDQVVLLMAGDGKGHNGEISNLLQLVTQNRQEYADFHGYNFHFINITKYDLHGVHPVWAKIPAILDTFISYPDAHWVWWLDLDAIIMNPEIDLNTHILSHAAMSSKFEIVEFLKGESKHTGKFMKKSDPKDIDILIAQDHNGLNAGSFFLRRSKFTATLLDFWQDPLYMHNEWAGKEQDALLHMVQHHPQIREHTGLISQRVLNGYPEGGNHMGWRKDDLVVHLAGCWVENKCNERWSNFWGKRITIEDLKAKGVANPTDHTGMVTKLTKEGTVYVPME
ncbi:hypothetical protein TWF694_001494 [Orbilia ellipsospora]|uniref:Uncharacterized protein n=1 Tax=Orbilia ellipsospora TaxID=2528407 RepID=A0AAV9XTC8_9PEZI